MPVVELAPPAASKPSGKSEVPARGLRSRPSMDAPMRPRLYCLSATIRAPDSSEEARPRAGAFVGRFVFTGMPAADRAVAEIAMPDED